MLWVRAGFLLTTVLGGFGVLLYAGLWLMLPADRRFVAEAPGLSAATRQGRRRRRSHALSDLGPWSRSARSPSGWSPWSPASPVAHCRCGPWPWPWSGIGVLWRQADEAQRERWLDGTARLGPLRTIVGGGGWASYGRIVAGVVLLVGAITLFFVRGGDFGLARNALVAAVLAVLGVSLMVGPWLLRLSSDLGEERAERIRSQERADVAAHLHDSVLQTLALIQKTAHDPAQVGRLARAQERDLRAWLFTSETVDGDTVASGLRRVAAEVEDRLGTPVEVVCVGADLAVTEELRPVLDAAREAMVNAAEHSGAARVDVYAERLSDEVEVFVRDRGTGFDPDRVADDRHGVRSSIIARMERHGGRAHVRSAPGEGTDVRLQMPIEKESSR